MERRVPLTIFNRGVIDPRALARVDVERVGLSAEQQTNWMPRTLGSMMLRPGLQFMARTRSDLQAISIPFVFSNSDYASLEFTPDRMRILEDGVTPLEREAEFSTTLTNGSFGADLSGWTDQDETGAVSDWVSPGYLRMVGTGYQAAIREQEVTISGADQGKVHSVRINVVRGPVLFRIGSTTGRDNVFSQAVLRTGEHSLAFTPTSSSIFIQFLSSRTHQVLIDSCILETAGEVFLTHPWSTVSALQEVRWQQVNDIVFLAQDNGAPRRVERRENNSWSFVEYLFEDGPFQPENTESITLTPSAQTGEITLTASQKIWRPSDVGALYRISSVGQVVESSLSAEATWTNSIRVTGVGASRPFTITIAGTWSATISLQRSIGDEGAWATVATYTTNQTVEFDDDLDNAIVFYRIGIDTGDYTSGTADLTLTYASGSITGTVRLTEWTNARTVSAYVISDLGGTDPSEVWAKGSWNNTDGWPSAVTEFDGRLWWFGKGRAWASISDAFESFDPDFTGDAGPINRRIGPRAVDKVNWALPLQRLLVGGDDAERSIRSSSLEEPITPSNYNSRDVSTLGSAGIPALHVDRRGIFVDRSLVRLYELEYDLNGYDYSATDLTTLVPALAGAGFTRIAVQRQPDTRIHCVKADGTVAILVRDKAEDVLCWISFETDGAVEDVYVLPGTIEDQVFYTVRRTISSGTIRMHERWAQEGDAQGGTRCMIADSFSTGTGNGSATITGLSHLEGQEVVVWADGADKGTATVSGGAITLSESVDDYVVGRGYRARYKSTKMSLNTRELGVTLSRRSRGQTLALILSNTHYQGLRYGPTFNRLDELPLTEGALETSADTIWETYAQEEVEFPGDWSNDTRLCLEANAPRPCTVMAAMLDVDWQP